MKFAHKMICLLVLVLSASFGLGGCWLLYSDFAVQRRTVLTADAALHSQICTDVQTDLLDRQRRGLEMGGAVAAGSRVDVYATGGTSTDVLASGVLVLATSASAQESTTDAKVSWITVAVAPESVQEIVAAAQKTELYFTLPGSEGER